MLQFILSLVTVLAVAGGVSELAYQLVHRLPTAEARARMKQLKSDRKELEGMVVACKSNLLTSTRESSISYYHNQIAAYGVKLDAIENEMVELRERKPRRAPAPKLNPKWDVNVCKHKELEPVVASGETETIAYICTNPACYDQLPLDHAAVWSWERANNVTDGWNDVQRVMAEEALGYRFSVTGGETYIPIRPDVKRFTDKLLEDKARHGSKIGAKRTPRGSWM